VPSHPTIDAADLIGTSGDRLASSRSGPFRRDAAWGIPDYRDRNLVAFRHWNPPEPT
jgi:hypothetical protein